jgi:hypothetical protein
LSGERLNTFPIGVYHHHLFNTGPNVLARAVRQEEEVKGIHFEKEEVNLSLFSDDKIVYIIRKS